MITDSEIELKFGALNAGDEADLANQLLQRLRAADRIVASAVMLASRDLPLDVGSRIFKRIDDYVGAVNK